MKGVLPNTAVYITITTNTEVFLLNATILPVLPLPPWPYTAPSVLVTHIFTIITMWFCSNRNTQANNFYRVLQQHNVMLLSSGASEATESQCGQRDGKKKDHAGGFKGFHISLPKQTLTAANTMNCPFQEGFINTGSWNSNSPISF